MIVTPSFDKKIGSSYKNVGLLFLKMVTCKTSFAFLHYTSTAIKNFTDEQAII